MKQPLFRSQRALRTVIATAVIIIANATAAWAQSTFSGGDGSSGNPFKITSVADLQRLATDVNNGTKYEGTYFKLMNDIDFNQADDENLRPTADWNVESTQSNFTPIGNSFRKSFQGYFDGGGKTISGIRIYISSIAMDSFAALFGYVYGATVTGVKVDNARFTGDQYCGGIVGYSAKGSTVSNCTVTDHVAIHAKGKDSHYHGGIVGYIAGSCSVINCTSSATLTIPDGVTGCKYYGGIVGCSNNFNVDPTTIIGNVAIGVTVSAAADTYYGAICGYVKIGTSTVSGNCYLNCTVAGTANATGVGVFDAGYQNNQLIWDVDGASHGYSLTLTDGVTTTTPAAVTIDGTNYYARGTSISLTQPEQQAGVLFESFTLNTSAIDGSTFKMPAQNSTVGATTISVYKLNLADGITANGTVAATYDGINYYRQGTAITLSGKQTGTLPVGYVYDGYAVNGTAIDGSSFKMPAKVTEVTSTNIPVYKLTLADGITATGTIAATYDGDNYYLQGTTITLSGRPDAGEGYVYPYTLDGTAIYGATFEMPARNLTVALGEKTDDWMYFYAGTSTDPFQVKNTNQLDQIAMRVNGGTTFSGQFFKLMNDIAYEYDSSTENNYTAIGKWVSSTKGIPFSGTFDGGGHTVSGIRIYKNSGDVWGDMNLGLFGYVKGGTVKNVTLADTRITGKEFCGGIVGYIDYGTVENCHALNDVTIHAVANNSSSQGGIAGFSSNSSISGCSSAVTLSVATGLTGCRGFGGIAGFTDRTLSHCLAVGVSIPVAVSGGDSGAITGFSFGSLDHNYYIDCKVGEATTNIGGPKGDINDNDNPDGAVPFSGIVLYDNGKANATTIANNSGQTQNVMLFGRTLYKDGSWNTLCLPFDIANINEYDYHYVEYRPLWPLYDATLMTLDNSVTSNTGYDSSTGKLTLDFDDAGYIEAGKPYIVKWNKPDGYDGHESDYDIKNPVFSNVTIADFSEYSGTDAEKCQAFLNAKAATSADGYVTFRGTFDPEAIYASPATNLYLGANNSIYYPSSADFRVNACRAYFQLNNGLTCGDPSSPKAVRAFSLGFGDNSELTGTQNVQCSMVNGQSSPAWYTLDGRRVSVSSDSSAPSVLPKGVYIHGGNKIVIK